MFKWIIFIALIISGSILAYLYNNVKALENNPNAIPALEVDGTLHMIHSYKNGVHHYVGSMSLPNSCHKIETLVVRDPKLAEIFDLRITTRDLQAETAFCSQLRSRYQFAVDEEGPEQVTLRVKVNGKPRVFKLVETTSAIVDMGTQQ
jgi:hypothetical protein